MRCGSRRRCGSRPWRRWPSAGPETRAAARRTEDFTVAAGLLDELLREVGARDLPLSQALADAALEAAQTYGDLAGHPARLNMGDCFAYACAKSLGASLLHKGNDFAQTDLA